MSNATKKSILIILMMIFSIGIIRYQVQLLSYLEWEDEVTHIVTSKLIHSGKRLYSEIHELHGPLTFLSGIAIETFGSFGVKAHRLPIAILQWIAWAAIFFSPVLKTQNLYSRFAYIAISATVSLIYLPEIFGHTYLFQVIAGLLLIIILAQYSLPSILEEEALSTHQIIIGNFLIACLPFLAFTYIPISGGLFIAGLSKRNFRVACLSFIFGLIFNIAFLASIGSIPGYIALHYWINLAVSRQFIEGEAIGIGYLVKSALNAITSDLSRFGIFVIISLALTKLAQYEKKIPWRSFLLGLGIASLLTRSQGFQGLTLLYLTFALPLVFLYLPKKPSYENNWSLFFLTPILFICLIKLFILSPANIVDRQVRTSSSFSLLVKKYTQSNDPIIAWPFQNYEYLLSDRLPASGNFFYLPWQAKYYQEPKLGIKIDSCTEIEKKLPKVMLISEYAFNGIDWKQYAPGCLPEILKKNYRSIPNTAIYLRSDIFKLWQEDNH